MTRLTRLYKAICNSNKHAHDLAASMNYQYSHSRREPDLQIRAVLCHSESQLRPASQAGGGRLPTCKSLVTIHVWHEHCGSCGGKARFAERRNRVGKNGQALWAHMPFSKPDAEAETLCSVQAESNSSPSKKRLCGQMHPSVRSVSLIK